MELLSPVVGQAIVVATVSRQGRPKLDMQSVHATLDASVVVAPLKAGERVAPG